MIENGILSIQNVSLKRRNDSLKQPKFRRSPRLTSTILVFFKRISTRTESSLCLLVGDATTKTNEELPK